MDVLNANDKVPHFDQKVVMKVTRLSFDENAKRSSAEVDFHASDFLNNYQLNNKQIDKRDHDFI